MLLILEFIKVNLTDQPIKIVDIAKQIGLFELLTTSYFIAVEMLYTQYLLIFVSPSCFLALFQLAKIRVAYGGSYANVAKRTITNVLCKRILLFLCFQGLWKAYNVM